MLTPLGTHLQFDKIVGIHEYYSTTMSGHMDVCLWAMVSSIHAIDCNTISIFNFTILRRRVVYYLLRYVL